MIDVLIPIKGHSERVPNKNFRRLAGRPLYKRILDTLSESKYIENIYIDTDVRKKFNLVEYEPIAPITWTPVGCHDYIHIIDRPEELRGDSVSVNALIQHDIPIMDADVILQTHITNPFLSTKTIDACIEKFQSENIDSMFGVTEYHKRFWNTKGKPVNHDPNELLRSQDLSPVYEDNSCIYLFTRKFFEKYKMRMNEKSKMFVIDAMEALDIDTEFDWRIAKCMIKL